MDRLQIIQALFQFGWKVFPTIEETVKKLTDDQLSLLQKLYAAFHGLSSIRDVIDHLQMPRFCSQPDTMQLNQTARWPDGHITWDVLQVPQQFTKDKYVACATEALRRWASVCGITPEYTPGNPRARIQLAIRSIDGPFGVLAESELPMSGVQVCHQWYDTGESWAAFDTPSSGNRNELDIVRVMCHELGHALGMNHIGAGNLLAPTYDQRITGPQAGDIKEMQARYGPPVVQPTPPATPPNGAAQSYVLRIHDGELSVDGFRLVQLMNQVA